MDVEKGTRQLKALIEKLERNNRTLRSHPTIEKIERGELSAPQLRHWATQLFIGNKAHNANILGLIYAKCDDFPARKAIVENLIEEELGRVSGANRSHPELYLEFGEAIGIPSAELLRAPMSVDATAMVHWMYWLAESKPLVRNARRHQSRLRTLQPRRLYPRNRRPAASLQTLRRRAAVLQRSREGRQGSRRLERWFNFSSDT